MNIYRVETSAGVGPYNDIASPTTISDALFKAHARDGGHHPGPWGDIPSFKEGGVYKFGFASKEQLNAWFGPEAREILKRAGYVVGVYKVDGRALKRGAHQIAFNPNHATRLNEESIT